MDECINLLRDATFFSTLDAKSGYKQVEVDEADRDKTAFTVHHSPYIFASMLFGLMNAPGAFKRAIDVVSLLTMWQYALV